MIIILLLVYISFMACGVKKQIVRSKSLSDSLLHQESTSAQEFRKRLTISGHRNDSLMVLVIRKDLSIDSLEWLIPDKPYSRLLRIKGIHFNAMENVLHDSRHDSVKLSEDTIVHNQAAMRMKIHVQKQKQTVSKQTERPTTLSKMIVPLIILAVAALLYLFRKKIFPIHI